VKERVMRVGFAIVRSLGWKRRTQRNSSAGIPSINEELKNVILKALRVNYVSQVGKRGNRYQTVTLGDVKIPGQRTGRSEALDQVNFEGKKVLDLGSNFGQISRGARARGAYLVDGYEIDPFFLEIARAINAHEEETRVSFYQRDIGDPSSYVEQYDIVLAFSVWAFLGHSLDRIAEITEQLLIVETHELDQDLPHKGHFPGAPPSPSSISEYLAQASRWFPCYRILGRTDRQRRAVIAFAKSELTLAAGLKDRIRIYAGAD
jgi:SAM-dependent methyltransferase